ELGELLCEPGQSLEVLEAGLPSLRVARPEGRRDDSLEQPAFAVGGRSECPQVARRDAVARQLSARERDLRVGFAVELLAAVRSRGQETEVLELADELGTDRRAVAEIVQAEEVFLVAEAERPSALPFRRGWRRQLLADHPQRQELVALEQQDRPQA